MDEQSQWREGEVKEISVQTSQVQLCHLVEGRTTHHCRTIHLKCDNLHHYSQKHSETGGESMFIKYKKLSFEAQ